MSHSHSAVTDVVGCSQRGSWQSLPVRWLKYTPPSFENSVGQAPTPPVGLKAMSPTSQCEPFCALFQLFDGQRCAVDAGLAGLAVISGYELFFHQGRDAFRIFTGREVDGDRLRAALLEPEADQGAAA